MSTGTAEPDLPPPVARAVAAVNAEDTEAFLDQFLPDGSVDDNGRVFEGREGIRAWSDKELIGAHTRFELTGSEPMDDGVALHVEVSSDGFNGYSRFAFQVEGDRVHSMLITA
ncbi:MAG TPA: nuclear transport factor 2 family protein [Solirubrobacterales bacterium]|nr:nuclear transport factor 2 family protein [Solirubrobacterales bacterium]